jgi:hypothetical protein
MTLSAGQHYGMAILVRGHSCHNLTVHVRVWFSAEDTAPHQPWSSNKFALFGARYSALPTLVKNTFRT